MNAACTSKPSGSTRSAIGGEADILHLDELRLDSDLARQILEEPHGLAVLDRGRVGCEMDETAAREQRAEAFAQLVEQAVELVGPRRHRPAREQVLQPHPLECRAFEHRCRRIGIIFVELGRSRPVIGEVEPAIERRLARPPRLRDVIPLLARDGEPFHQLLVAHHLVDQLEAHRVHLFGRGFEILLDLRQREGIGGALVPIGFDCVAHRRAVIDEPDRVGPFAPVAARVDRDPAHQLSCVLLSSRCSSRSVCPSWSVLGAVSRASTSSADD
ncbi:hypothetical protein QP175_09815 [Sphingomonas aerolata]